MGSVCPSFDYLATCSETSLESFELSRLDRISTIRRDVQELIQQWIGYEVELRLARSRRDSLRTEDCGGPAVRAADSLQLPEQLVLALPASGNADTEQRDKIVVHPDRHTTAREVQARQRRPAARRRLPARSEPDSRAEATEGATTGSAAKVDTGRPPLLHSRPALGDEVEALRELRVFLDHPRAASPAKIQGDATSLTQFVSRATRSGSRRASPRLAESLFSRKSSSINRWTIKKVS